MELLKEWIPDAAHVFVDVFGKFHGLAVIGRAEFTMKRQLVVVSPVFSLEHRE
jgi:hypothetical protein